MRARAGDTLSTETQYSGLPKACLLGADVTSLGGAIGVQDVIFDKVIYNYGGYALTKSGIYFLGVVIAEPGVYSFDMSIGFVSNNQTSLIGFKQNGNLTFRDGLTREYAQAQPHSAGGSVFESAAGISELRSGDVLTAFWAQPGGGTAQNAIVGSPWFSVKKEGGQY